MESSGFIEVKVMKLIIHPSFKEQFDIIKDKEGYYTVYGRIYDNFAVCHLMGLDNALLYYKPIGYLTIGKKGSLKIDIENLIDFPFLHVIIASDDIDNMKIEIYHDKNNIDSEIELDIDLINLERLFIRIDKKETPLSVINGKNVAIIGMGSGGSLLAVYLAKSGIKNFIFIDDDHLETHNIIRHICGLDQLGRYKTKAVKDYIEFRIPDVSIRTVEQKFSINTKADSEFFLDLFTDVDLIVAVSGEHDVNFALNDFIHSNRLQIPIIYAGTFDGVKGGLMFKVDPRKEEFCYHCVYADPESSSVPSTVELEKKISYDRTMQEQLAQPGLGLDVDNLTILVSKFCLDVLLTEIEHGLYHFTHNFYMWFNRTKMDQDETTVKFEGLELYYYEDLKKDPRCPFHTTQALNGKEHK
jgi:molybdopterin/thiamine biosynthesis adenylyltransferase